MADSDVVWPVGTTEQDPALSDRPMVFDPKGFLVAILPDADEAERGAAALRDAGFADRSLRIFTSQQMLDDYARHTAQPGLTRRVVAALTADQETIDLYYGHARDGCSALWVHVTDDDADRAIRSLAGCRWLHIRHYSDRRQSDFYLQRPTS
jgi:hypothetical protein